MNILVIGANGQIGKKVVSKLLKSEHHPKAMVRSEEQVEQFEKKGADVVVADLEKDISHVFNGVNGVVFTAGSGAHTGKDKTELVDHQGAIKAIDEAVKNDVKRFIMVSAFGADLDRDTWKESMAHYYRAKSAADRYLMQSGLDFTILKPGRLTNENGTGNIEIAARTEQRGGSITRTDVATTIVKIMGVRQSIGKSYELLQGDTPIDRALNELKG